MTVWIAGYWYPVDGIDQYSILGVYSTEERAMSATVPAYAQAKGSTLQVDDWDVE